MPLFGLLWLEQFGGCFLQSRVGVPSLVVPGLTGWVSGSAHIMSCPK